MPCLCSPDYPNSPPGDNLLIYHAPISIKFNNSYVANNNRVKFNRSKFDYIFTQQSNYPNSRTFEVQDFKIKLKANQKEYILKEYHFHDHQENVINDDRNGVMEVHFVFQELDQNNYSVLGFIFKLSKHSDKLITNIIKNKRIKVPKFKKYYTYSGSLTKVNPVDIPQLAVNWNLNSKYLKISQKDLDYFRANLCRQSSALQNTNGRNTIFVK